MFKGNGVILATKYEYFCTTGNKNFKYVFLKFIFFKLTDGISHVLIDLKF